jgi:hypothetical protein
MFDPVSLAIYVGLTLVSQSLAARKNRKKISDIEFPTDEPNRKIPYVAGTVEISPHVIDWGDFKRSPINLDIPIAFGLFAGGLGVLITWLLTRLPFGYRYYIGMALGLCHGPDVTIKAIKMADKIVWTGSQSGGSFTINKPGQFGAEGGVYAVCDHVPGSMVQTRNSYRNTLRPNVPAFRGTSVIYWRGPSSLDDAPTGDASAFLNEVRYCGYIGRSTIVKDWRVRLNRFPNYLETDFSVVKSVHANFAEVIYELLTDQVVGLGLATSLINNTSFEAAAETLYNESLGCSFKWEQPTEINDILTRLLETIDGVLYSDLDTGEINLDLIRPDYDVEDLVLIDETHVGVELELHRSDPNDSVGEIRIPFTDVENNFVEATALWQSLSNRNQQGFVSSQTLERFGLGDAQAANMIATRDGRALAVPLVRATIRTNRQTYNFTVGTPFRLAWGDDLEETVFRVLEIDYGTLEDGKITIKAIEDQFTIGDSQLGDVVSTAWPDPIVVNPTDGALRKVISTTETTPPASPELGDRYWVPAGATGDWSGQTGFASWDGTQWIFEPIDDSTFVGFFNEDDGQIYYWDGSALQTVVTTAYNTIQEEGSALTRRQVLNFIGHGVTAADDSGDSRTNVTITAYDTVQEEGSALTQRPSLNFIGSTVTAADDAANSRTNVTITPKPLKLLFEFGDGKNSTSLEANQTSRFPDVPAGTISKVRIEGDAAASAVVDIQTSTADPPSYSSICASAKPTLSTDKFAEDSTLTGWTTTVADGTKFRAVIDSVSGMKQVSVVLTIDRT